MTGTESKAGPSHRESLYHPTLPRFLHTHSSWRATAMQDHQVLIDAIQDPAASELNQSQRNHLSVSTHDTRDSVITFTGRESTADPFPYSSYESPNAPPAPQGLLSSFPIPPATQDRVPLKPNSRAKNFSRPITFKPPPSPPNTHLASSTNSSHAPDDAHSSPSQNTRIPPSPPQDSPPRTTAKIVPDAAMSAAIARHKASREAAGLSTHGQYFYDPKADKHFFAPEQDLGASTNSHTSSRSHGIKKSNSNASLHSTDSRTRRWLGLGPKKRRPSAASGSHDYHEEGQMEEIHVNPYEGTPPPAIVLSSQSEHRSMPSHDTIFSTSQLQHALGTSSPPSNRPVIPQRTSSNSIHLQARPPIHDRAESAYSEYSVYSLPEGEAPQTPKAQTRSQLSPSPSPWSRHSDVDHSPSSQRSTSPAPSAFIEPTSQAATSTTQTTMAKTKAAFMSTNSLSALLKDGQPIDKDDPMCCLQMGIETHEHGSLEESAVWFERSAKARGGCGPGMLMYGLTLRHGWGCPPQPELAFTYLQKAAETVLIDLDRVIREQRWTEKEQSQAAKCELVLSIFELGQCYRRGWGVPKDKKVAISYFELAAKLGDPDAQQELGFCYANGKGCKKDIKKAAQYYRMAAAQGYISFGMNWIFKEKYDD